MTPAFIRRLSMRDSDIGVGDTTVYLRLRVFLAGDVSSSKSLVVYETEQGEGIKGPVSPGMKQ
jgi:hypothetical protein